MKPDRRVVALRLPIDLIEAADETASEMVVSRNRLMEQALSEYLQRVGDRMIAGDSPAQLIGLLR